MRLPRTTRVTPTIRIARTTRTRRSERGTSSVELALIVPVFMLLILGTVDLGQAIVLHSMAGEAAREGARVGQVQVTPNATVTAPPVLTTAQATAIAGAARSQAGALGAKLSVTPVAANGANGPYVQVVVTTSYQPAAGQFLGVTNVPISASSTMYLP